MDIPELARMTTTLTVYHLKGVIQIDRIFSIIKSKGIAAESLSELAKSPDDPDIQSKFHFDLERRLSSDEHFTNWLNDNVASARSGIQANALLDRYEVVHRESEGEVSISANADRFKSSFTDKGGTTGRRNLRDWWFEIQRRFQGYSCYGIFLILPSDKEAIRYLNEFGIELDIISRNNCVIIYLSDGNFRRPNFRSDDWKNTIDKHVSGGGSTQVARLFEIGYDKLPCLVLFEDIRSDRHIVVTLKGITSEEIAERMRTIFSVIQTSIVSKQNSLDALGRSRNNEKLLLAGQSIVTEIRGLASKSIETALEAWFKANIQ